MTIWVVGIGQNAKTHVEDMNKIAGDNRHVTFFDNFEELKEKFVDEFKKTFCGKLRLLRKEKSWCHIVVFMIE